MSEYRAGYNNHCYYDPQVAHKFRVDNLHISPNHYHILSSMSISHGSPKTNFIALKEKTLKNI